MATNASAGAMVKIENSNPLARGACRALLVGTAGTATIVDGEGNSCVDVPLQAGYNPIRARAVTVGTAANVWALY